PTEDCPINDVRWYEAAEYCNWLSEQEGIPEEQWCYLPNENKEFGPGMKMRPDYLSLAGYRLPTEAEWEYACRSGAVTSRYYGETEELLGKYAWYTTNSQNKAMQVGGSRKPNDLGLFDMLGNAVEWCHGLPYFYKAGAGGQAIEDIEDKEDIKYIKDDNRRLLRGGSFDYLAAIVRSANRTWVPPGFRYNYIGFRPARTFR